MKDLYLDTLREQLARRSASNPRYSLRAFARALRIDVGTLSKILAGKQIPSHKLAKRIIDGLGLPPSESRAFAKSVMQKRESRQKEKFIPGEEDPELTGLAIDTYRALSEWYHLALLELTYVKGFQSSPNWIARELGISPLEAKLARDRLVKLGLLRQEGKRLVKTHEQLSSVDKHLTTPALRQQQRQFLEKAIFSLENDPIETRNVSSMTMAIDPRKLPLAKKMIREFNQTLCRALESGPRERVYNLEIALCPVQREAR